MARPELSIIPPRGLPAWWPPEVVAQVRDLQAQIRRAGTLFGASTDVHPSVFVILDIEPERRPILAGVVGTQYSISREHRESVLAALRFAEREVMRRIAQCQQLIDRARAELDEFAYRARMVLLALARPRMAAYREFNTDVALRMLQGLVGELEQTISRARQRIAAEALGIEEWVQVVARLGPPRGMAEQRRDHEDRVRRLQAALRGLRYGTATVEQALTAALRNGRGLVFGDDPAMRQLLIQHMAAMRAEGVGTLVLQLPPEANAHIATFYLTGGTLDDVRRLAADLASAGVRVDDLNSSTDVIAAARSVGIRTVAGDPGIAGAGRDLDRLANPYMAGIIQQAAAELPAGQKVIALVHSQRTNAFDGVESYLGSEYYSIDAGTTTRDDTSVQPGRARVAAQQLLDLRIPWLWIRDNSTLVINLNKTSP